MPFSIQASNQANIHHSSRRSYSITRIITLSAVCSTLLSGDAWGSSWLLLLLLLLMLLFLLSGAFFCPELLAISAALVKAMYELMGTKDSEAVLDDARGTNWAMPCVSGWWPQRSPNSTPASTCTSCDPEEEEEEDDDDDEDNPAKSGSE